MKGRVRWHVYAGARWLHTLATCWTVQLEVTLNDLWMGIQNWGEKKKPRLSQIDNYNVKVSHVEDCKLTGFTALTGLSASWFLSSEAQYRPHLCCAVSQSLWMSQGSLSVLLWVTACWLSKVWTLVVVIGARTHCTATNRPFCVSTESESVCLSRAQPKEVQLFPHPT